MDDIIALDDQWRRLTGDIDNLKKKKNAVQKEVGIKKKAGQECDDQIAEVKSIGEEVLHTFFSYLILSYLILSHLFISLLLFTLFLKYIFYYLYFIYIFIFPSSTIMLYHLSKG